MSEYIEIEAELGDDGQSIMFETNLPLTSEAVEEHYNDEAPLAQGSPLAQSLAGIPGVLSVTIANSDLTVVYGQDADWHVIIADVTAALKDFFL